MPDNITTPTPAATSPAVETSAPDTKVAPAPDIKADERLAAIDKRISALADTVTAALTPRQPAQGSAKPGELPAHFRSLLRQQGLTDADIDANAPLVVPFLSAMLATDGAVMLGGIQQVKDEVDMVKASRNQKKYPYWNEVEDKIVELREEAAKSSQYLTPDAAYKAAVAVSLDKIEEVRAQRKAASESADVTAQQIGTHHGSRPTASHVKRTAVTGEDLAAMSKEDRKKFYDQIGDFVIR